jgi:hypothetical protein
MADFMRIQKKKHIKRNSTLITALVLIPIILFAGYFGFYFYIVADLTSYIYEAEPSTDEFYPLEDINETELRSIANEFEFLQEEFHIPINISQVVTFNATTGKPIRYHSDDNGALHTSEALTATCLRYASLPAGAEKDDALRLIKKMLTGLQMLIEVPNGGLGPDYPGTAIARFYAPPEKRNDGNYTWLFDDYFRHFNGTGKYSQWRCRLYTSKDELAGYFMAIAACLKLVDNPYIQNITKLIIGQFTEGMLKSFWQEVSGDGKPNGVHFQWPTQGQWKLLVMRMATIAYPENDRYKQIYDYYLFTEKYITKYPSIGDSDLIDNYYANYFELCVIFGLMLVEDDQEIIDIYVNNYEESTHPAFKGHRNAFLNAVYLAMCKMRSDIEPNYDLDKIAWDVKDQLWRFVEFDLCPYDTTFGGQNKTISREEKGGDWLEVDPNIAKWKNFVDTTALGKMYQWATYGLMDGIFKTRYLKPATVEMSRPNKILWNRNPFTEDGANQYNNNQTITQYHGASFSLPYWMMVYYGYFGGN